MAKKTTRAPRARPGDPRPKFNAKRNRVIGQIRVNGEKIVEYGALGEDSPAEIKVVLEKLKKYTSVPKGTPLRKTVRDLHDEYNDRDRISATTKTRYKRLTGYLPAWFLDKRIPDVNGDDVKAALAEVKGHPKRKSKFDRTRQMVYKHVRAIFKRPVNDGIITVNPAMASVVKDVAPQYHREEKPRVFTRWEQGFILKAAAERGLQYVAYFMLCLSMPLRPGESFGLRKSDLNLRQRTAKIQRSLSSNKDTKYMPVPGPLKTPESYRVIALNPEVAAAIRDVLEARLAAGTMTPESYLFTAPRGGPIEHSKFTERVWRKVLVRAAELAHDAARKAGDDEYRFPVEATLYACRHTAIENLKAAGTEKSVVQALAGHASPITTDGQYNQPTLQRKLEAAQAVGDWLFAAAAPAPADQTLQVATPVASWVTVAV